MTALLGFVQYVLSLYSYVVIASVVLGWLVAFNVINPYNNFVRSLMMGIGAVTEPFLRPIRRLLPRAQGIDFSPLVLLLAVFFLQSVVIGTCASGFLMPLACQR